MSSNESPSIRSSPLFPSMNLPALPTTRREAFTTAGLAMLGASLASSTHAAESASISTDPLNVRSFGAMGDGKTDDTAAFQKALDAAHAAGGGSVWVPAGSYLLEGSLLVPHGVCLQGTWTAPISQPWKGPPGAVGSAAGSNLLTTHGHGDANAPAFIRLTGNSAVRGIAIHHPRQTPTDPPIAYPWSIASAAAAASASPPWRPPTCALTLEKTPSGAACGSWSSE